MEKADNFGRSDFELYHIRTVCQMNTGKWRVCLGITACGLEDRFERGRCAYYRRPTDWFLSGSQRKSQ